MNKPKIFDVFLLLNELDLLEIRLEALYEYVDYFVITEINETFSGIAKPFLFEKEKKRYQKYSDKIIYNPINKNKLNELQKAKWSEFVSDFNKIISYQNQGKPYKKLHK